jgi:hypothetical protein
VREHRCSESHGVRKCPILSQSHTIRRIYLSITVARWRAKMLPRCSDLLVPKQTRRSYLSSKIAAKTLQIKQSIAGSLRAARGGREHNCSARSNEHRRDKSHLQCAIQTIRVIDNRGNSGETNPIATGCGRWRYAVPSERATVATSPPSLPPSRAQYDAREQNRKDIVLSPSLDIERQEEKSTAHKQYDTNTSMAQVLFS